jgi:hypothetical protein
MPFGYPRTRPQQRDPDNCVSSLKEIVDAVVRAGVVVDDGPGRMRIQPGRAQIRCWCHTSS